LRGYEISARPFRIEVEIAGIDPNSSLRDTLEVDCAEGDMIAADWLSQRPDAPTKFVPWPKSWTDGQA
jgi:hypothetical protein